MFQSMNIHVMFFLKIIFKITPVWVIALLIMSEKPITFLHYCNVTYFSDHETKKLINTKVSQFFYEVIKRLGLHSR